MTFTKNFTSDQSLTLLSFALYNQENRLSIFNLTANLGRFDAGIIVTLPKGIYSICNMVRCTGDNYNYATTEYSTVY